MIKVGFIAMLLAFALHVNAQVISTFAGGGTMTGNNIPATSKQINTANGGVFDPVGNYYFSSPFGNCIYKVSTTGNISAIAGIGSSGFSGDGGQATAAELYLPAAVAIDSNGSIYVADAGNNRIRRINSSGIISTIAGTGVAGYNGDGIPATASALNDPLDISIDRNQNIYVCDFFNSRVRKINTSGFISTVAGNGTTGYSGDNCRADTSRIGHILGMCVDYYGNLLLCDVINSRVFKVDGSNIITTVAGKSSGYLFNGDEIPATNAQVDPYKIASDKFGNVFICEYHNFRIRKIDVSGVIHTVAGNGIQGFSGDGGTASSCMFNYPAGVTLDTCGGIYVSDVGNNRVRKITYPHCNFLDVPQTASKNTGLQIFPNPANDLVRINGLREQTNYRLLDIVGRVIMQGTLNRGDNELSLVSASPGVYVLEITTQNERVMKRIVKE